MRYCQSIRINYKPDTGAQAKVVSLNSFNSLEIHATVSNTTTVVTAYGNKCIKQVSVTKYLINCKNSIYDEEYFVVDYQPATM